MLVKVKKLYPWAILPVYSTDGAGAFDIAWPGYFSELRHEDSITLGPGMQAILNTGLSFELPQDHVMLLFSRSGHGFKDEIRLSNCVGVIDEDYRGEVRVALKNDSNRPKRVNVGDRVLQALVIKREKVQFLEVQELSETERGSGGFGSTGA